MVKKALMVIYLVSSLGLLFLGYIFEEAYGSRRITLIVCIVMYAILLLASLLIREREKALIILAIAMVGILLGAEVYSKYALNYFMHTLYIMLIFYNIASITSRSGIAISLVITLVSFVKFIQLILIDNTFANLALMVFFGSVQLLVVVIALFLKVYQEETRKTKTIYKELLETHNQLKAYASEIKELSRVEARALIARDLHDTLGHELTGLIMQMEMASTYIDQKDLDQGKDLLNSAKVSARESLVRVREIVDTLKNHGDQDREVRSIESLTQAFSQKTACDVDLKCKGKGKLDPQRSQVLYRIVQESLTNAVRHGHATRVMVTLIYGSEKVQFDIEDNGLGCESIVMGNGLGGMVERLKEVGGHIEVEGIPSFKVWGELPYEEA